MKFQDVASLEGPFLRAKLHCFFHGGDVAEHGARGVIACLGSFRLGPGESPLREYEPLDARRRDGFGAKQPAREHFETRDRRRVAVEHVHLTLGHRNCRRDLGGEGELQPPYGIGNKGFVPKRLAFPSTAGGIRLGKPDALNESRHTENLTKRAH